MSDREREAVGLYDCLLGGMKACHITDPDSDSDQQDEYSSLDDSLQSGQTDGRVK